MKRERMVAIACDEPGCNAEELIDMQRVGETWTDTHTDEQLKALGWYVAGSAHYCPNHRKWAETGACNPSPKGV